MPELIITDENFEQFLADDLVDGLPAKHFDGYPRLMGCLPRGSSPTYHGAAGSIKPLPKTDWPNAIAKAKSDGVFLRDIATKLGLKADNQNGHGTCWMHGPANAVRMWRAARGFKTIMLCAESALPETGRGLNSGGSIDDSARAMEIGYCDVAFSSGPYDSPNSRFKDGWKENRKLHSATRIIELGQSGDMLGEYVACAVAGIPVVCDWNWWRHCTLGATDARITNGNLEVGIWNSWDVSWGENGFGYLSGRKTIPDAAFAVLDCVNSPA